MNSRTQSRGTLWQLLITSLPKVPWKGFVLGLFIPLMLMDVAHLFGVSVILGPILALGWCVLFFGVDFWLTGWPCVFPVMTFFMTASQFAAGMLAVRHPEWASAMLLVPVVDNVLMALVFLGSLWTQKPLVLLCLDETSLATIPEDIRKSRYYLVAWRWVTLVWGGLYGFQSLFLGVALMCRVPGAKVVDYVLGWPLVLILLLASVAFPRWYWREKAAHLEKGIAAESPASEAALG